MPPPPAQPWTPTRLPDHQVEVVEEAGSTNALVTERAQAGGPEGLVVVAEHQTAGRGRLDRTWETPPRSGLTFSVLLRPTVPGGRAGPGCRCSTGHAVSTALRAAGFDAVGEVAERRAARDRRRGAQGRRDPGRAGRDADRSGCRGRDRAQRRHDRRRAARPRGDVPRASRASAPDRTELLGLVLRHPLGLVRRLAGAAARRPRPGSRRRTPPCCATVGRDVSVALPGGETLTRPRRRDRRGAAGWSSRAAASAPPSGAGDVVHVRDA